MRRPVLFTSALCWALTSCATGGPPVASLPAQGGEPVPVTAPPDDATDLAARLARAPGATAAAGSALTTTVARVTGLPGRAEPFTMGGQGAIDFATGRSRTVLDVAPAGAAPGAGTRIETVVVDDLVYVRAPWLAAVTGASKPWVRLDATKASERAPDGSGIVGLTALTGNDLSAPIALLAGVDPSSVNAAGGPDGQDGITHLTATVDPLTAARHHGGQSDPAALEAFLDRLAARQLDVDVTIDDHDRLRRVSYQHVLPGPAGDVTQRFEVSYHGFGADVDISAPPEHLVSDRS